VPIVQNIKYYDKRVLLLDNNEPDRMTTSEKKPLLVDFFVLWRIVDVKQYYVSVQGDEEAARRRLSQTVRANLAEEINKRTVHDAISGERDKIMATTRQKADGDAKSIGVEIVDVRLRRVELPPDVTGPVYARMESERRRVANELRSQAGGIGEDPRRRRPPAHRNPRRRLPRGAEGQGRRRRPRGGDLRAGLRHQSRVLRVLPQPRGLQGDLPQQERCDGARPTRNSSATCGRRAAVRRPPRSPAKDPFLRH
jgi:regulator of protease activity HflC (stomatin/prohibitin superfamily)